MSEYLAGKSVRKVNKGIRVVSEPLAILNGANDIFTVVGGSIFAHQIVGRVTTQIAGTATTCRVRMNDGAATQTLVAVAATITSNAVGRMIALSGTASTMQTNAVRMVGQTNDIMLPTGTIQQVTSAARSGAIQWELFYTPLDDGAHVRPA